MSDAAIGGWYTNYREEALLLIIKAAMANPDDGVLLNNCAAMLNMGGLEQIAIPLLKYILQSYPDNGMVLNNIGQGYAGLGETDTAMYYLGRCITSEPDNVEANNTARAAFSTLVHCAGNWYLRRLKYSGIFTLGFTKAPIFESFFIFLSFSSEGLL